MSRSIHAVVVDASVAVKWVLFEEYSEAAAHLLRHCDELHAPAHWLAEAANAARKRCSRRLITQVEANQCADILAAAPIRVTPLAPLMRRAMLEAFRLSLTVYDGLYVALAAQLDLPFVTADRRLFEAVPRRPGAVDVRWIGDLWNEPDA
ncbi:MAG TPA: type II toxin-antitoxin system VapC family toxin [Acetobacteraceae bacterium]|nr:type II toxin-antitoxin system VapC family toxin [Acetobacteraceae bacterium]